MSIHERMRESSHFKWYTPMPPQVGMVTMVTIFHSTPKNDQNCWLSLKYSHSQPKKKHTTTQGFNPSSLLGVVGPFSSKHHKDLMGDQQKSEMRRHQHATKAGLHVARQHIQSRDFPEPARPVSATNLPWETVNYSVCGCYMVCYA